MRSRPDYPIINPVESVLISNKLPTKLLASTAALVQSKHDNDQDSFMFTSPSKNCFQKLQKICPIDAKSVGSDSNANLRAFIIIVFQSALIPQDGFYLNLLIEKITNQLAHLIKNAAIFNHKHQQMSIQNIIKVVSGFLKTLQNKKLKNPQNFDLLKQFQSLPIILDYTIIIFRAILDQYGQQNAKDFTQIVKTKQSYVTLSEYFDINLIRKDNFYLFSQNCLFIYKGDSEHIFGYYQSSGSSQLKKQKLNNISSMHAQNRHIQIMECSMESGSMMISSRNAQDSTPYFNALHGQQFVFRSKERKQESNADQNKHNKFDQIDQSKISSKCYDSKGSQFQVNIFSEENNKFFNNKYKKSNRSKNSQNNHSNQKNLSAETSKESSFPKFAKKKGNPVFMSNNTQNPKIISPIKKVSSDKCLSLSSEIQNYTQQNKDLQKMEKPNENIGMTNEKMILKSKEKLNQDNPKLFQKKDPNCNQQNFFPWQNQERRLRRVQTICYKTCSTCHRRFYRNEIQSNVLQIMINQIPKIDSNKDIIKKNIQIVSTKQTPQFLNKKFNKRIGQMCPKIQSPRNVQNSPRHNLKDHTKVPQLTWLNKRGKTQNQNQEETKPLELTLPQHLTYNSNSKPQLAFKSDSNSQKTNLTPNNLLIKDKQSKETINTPQQDIERLVNTNDNKKPPYEQKQAQTKFKSFFTLKSQKELQKIKSIDKYDFFKGKISKDGVFTNQKNTNVTIQIKNCQLSKQNTSLGKYGENKNSRQNFDKKDVVRAGNKEMAIKSYEKKKIETSKSVERRVPNFVKKDSLNNALDMILNN